MLINNNSTQSQNHAMILLQEILAKRLRIKILIVNKILPILMNVRA